jgi:predicted N-formylglutamate amidohydrolase
VHSFTPELNGKVRTADVGLLYDPTRDAERELCRRWQKALLTQIAATRGDRTNIWSDYRIRRNYPYRGSSDGLTTTLRRVFPALAYIGIELEVNQALLSDRRAEKRVGDLLARSFPIFPRHAEREP